LIYFGIAFFGITIDAMTAVVYWPWLNIGAFMVRRSVRGAIQSVPKGQYEASNCINFTASQRCGRINACAGFG